MPERMIVDASALVDLLVGSSPANEVADRLRGSELHAPAHFDAEVLSALGRLHRADHLTARQTEARVERLATFPVERHALSTLLVGAWKRRHNLRLVDALYVELADQLDMPIITTDNGMAAATSAAELITDQHP